jgi:hypothetical protein
VPDLASKKVKKLDGKNFFAKRMWVFRVKNSKNSGWPEFWSFGSASTAVFRPKFA